MGPRLRGATKETSWHRKSQGLAAAAHVDGREADDGEAPARAIGLIVDLELALAGAQHGGAAPVQRLVLEFQRPSVAVHRLGETEDLPRQAADVGMQARAGFDTVPAAVDHRLAV